MADVIFALGWREVKAPHDLEKAKQFIVSSVPSPSTANIKYAAIVYENKPTLTIDFQEFLNAEDFVKSLGTFEGTESGKQPELIFKEKGRPNARKLLYLLVNGSSLPSDDVVAQWNETFMKNDIVFVPVVFGSVSEGTKYKPFTPAGTVVTVEPGDDPKEKGIQTSEGIAKGL